MTELSADYKALSEYRPKHKVRFVTAASLFDGRAYATPNVGNPGPVTHASRPVPVVLGS